jgi:hypothetical protein
LNARGDVNHNEDDLPEFESRFNLPSPGDRFNAEDAHWFFGDCQAAATRQRMRAWLLIEIAAQHFRDDRNNAWLIDLLTMICQDGAIDMEAMRAAAETLERASAERNRRAREKMRR